MAPFSSPTPWTFSFPPPRMRSCACYRSVIGDGRFQGTRSPPICFGHVFRRGVSLCKGRADFRFHLSIESQDSSLEGPDSTIFATIPRNLHTHSTQSGCFSEFENTSRDLCRLLACGGLGHSTKQTTFLFLLWKVRSSFRPFFGIHRVSSSMFALSSCPREYHRPFSSGGFFSNWTTSMSLYPFRAPRILGLVLPILVPLSALGLSSGYASSNVTPSPFKTPIFLIEVLQLSPKMRWRFWDTS